MATNIYKERPSIDNFGGDVASYGKALDEYNQTGSYTMGQPSQPKVQQPVAVNQQTQQQTAEQQAKLQQEKAQRDMLASQRALQEPDNRYFAYGTSTPVSNTNATPVSTRQSPKQATQPTQPQTPRYNDIEKAVIDTYAKAGIRDIDPLKKAEAITNLQKGIASGYYKDIQQAQGELEQTVYKGINSRNFFADLNLNRDIASGLRQTPQYADAKARYDYILPYKGADYNAIYNGLTTNRIAVGGRAWEDLKLANGGIETPDMLKAKEMYNKQKYTDNLNTTMSQVYKQLTGMSYNSNVSFMENMKSIIDQATKTAGVTEADAQAGFDKQKQLLMSGPEVQGYLDKIKSNNAKKAELESAKNRILDELKTKFPGATTATLVGISSQFTKDIDKQLYDLNLDSDNANAELKYYSDVNSSAADIYQKTVDANRTMRTSMVGDVFKDTNVLINEANKTDSQRIVDIQTNTDNAAGIVGDISSELEVPIKDTQRWTNRAKELASTGMSEQAIRQTLFNEMQNARKKAGGNMFTVEQAAAAKNAALDEKLKEKNIENIDSQMKERLAKLPYEIQKTILDNEKLANDILNGNYELKDMGEDAWGTKRYAMYDKKTGTLKMVSDPSDYMNDTTKTALNTDVPESYQEKVNKARAAMDFTYYGQCGTFVNNFLGIPNKFGDSFESKMANANSSEPVVGGAVIFKTNTKNGHVGIVVGVDKEAGTMVVKDSNYGDNELIQTRTMDISEASGFYDPSRDSSYKQDEKFGPQDPSEIVNEDYKMIESFANKINKPGAINAISAYDPTKKGTIQALKNYGITPSEAEALKAAPMKSAEYDSVKKIVLDGVLTLSGAGWSDNERAGYLKTMIEPALKNDNKMVSDKFYDFVRDTKFQPGVGDKSTGGGIQAYNNLQQRYKKITRILDKIDKQDLETGKVEDIVLNIEKALGTTGDNVDNMALAREIQALFNEIAKVTSGSGVTGNEEERIKNASAMYGNPKSVNIRYLMDDLKYMKTLMYDAMTVQETVKSNPKATSIIKEKLDRDFPTY